MNAQELSNNLYETHISLALWAECVDTVPGYVTVDHIYLNTNRVHDMARAGRVLCPLGYEFTGSGTSGATFGVPKQEPCNPFSRENWGK